MNILLPKTIYPQMGHALFFLHWQWDWDIFSKKLNRTASFSQITHDKNRPHILINIERSLRITFCTHFVKTLVGNGQKILSLHIFLSLLLIINVHKTDDEMQQQEKT